MRDRGFVSGAALAFIAVLWLGLLLGVSFLATPVKFQAASLSLPVALDVGQATFGLFSKVEWALAALTAGCLLWARPGRRVALIFLPLLAVVAAQGFWLLPVLDARLEAVIAGSPPPPSSHHLIYILAEAAKALLLLALSLASFGRMATGLEGASTGMPNVEAAG